jgi:hypothetical protein
VLLKNWAWTFFPYKSRHLALLCTLAHNFVHKKCEEARLEQGLCSPLQAAEFFSTKISLIQINDLPLGNWIPHKFIHRNCGQLQLTQGKNFARWKRLCCPAAFLRTAKYPLRINALPCRGVHCAHFYPQKVCRTLLAAKLATRYIAQFIHV